MIAAGAAQAASPVYCPIRIDRTETAFAAAVVRADRLRESAAAGRGDHCDIQDVTGPVVRVLKGPLREGQTLSFTLSQGACGSAHGVDNAFVAQGDHLVVLLKQAVDGRLYQIQAETPADYAANERACGR